MKTFDCYICHLENQESQGIGALDHSFKVNCQRCGKYLITNEALSLLPSLDKKYKLSAWVRDINERSQTIPNIKASTIKTLINSFPDYTPIQRQLILMRSVERRTDYPGKSTPIVPKNDYPLAWATCEKELNYYLQNLVDRKLLNLPSKGHSEINDIINDVAISASGWEYLEKHSKIAAISDQAFVAMSFSESLYDIWKNSIKAAIEKAGYKAYRIDNEKHNERIDVKLMAEIKNSKFLIADVTDQKQGVYFEAGYALGLGIPVIWSCRQDNLEKVHFDTRQYNHIVWQNEEQLKEVLYNFICAIIGKK
jgi:nucleoside 2-deoxyribosyltransferase